MGTVTYWDGGNWAGLGFNSASPEPATVTYFLHGPQKDGPSATELAALDYDRIHNPVTVKR